LKSSRLNKVIGLAIGETSLTAAEIVSGEKPSTRRLAEFVYPAGVSIHHPAALGAALGQFLKEKDFSAKSVIVGIPARWLVVKPKEVPPADAHTLSEMLRIQAEGEFSSELKDLVYDYAAGGDAGGSRTVLLIATPKRYIDAATQVCTAAKLNAVAVTPSAIALSNAVAVGSRDALVLTVGPSGAELTSQSEGVASALRHLRGPSAERSFVGELRRAISTLPSNGKPRELILWDHAGMDAKSLGESLGFKVRSGDLPVLGIDTSQAERNGDGRRYAAAVALGLAGTGENRMPVDFLHSRLAPPRPRLVPPWTLAAALGGIVLIGLIALGYSDLQRQQTALDNLNNTLSGQKDQVAAADVFIAKVSIAEAWHGGNPRYLALLRDITNTIPDDVQTYATSLHISETPKAPTSVGSNAVKTVEVRTLTGQLTGKTGDQQEVQGIMDAMKRNRAFIEVKNTGAEGSVRNRDVTFTINFIYLPPTQ
jgi:hypothetical protein